VTELLTRYAFPDAMHAYDDLLPAATRLHHAIGLKEVLTAYFRTGYDGLERTATRLGVNLQKVSPDA
jgi:hypothetical protein